MPIEWDTQQAQHNTAQLKQSLFTIGFVLYCGFDLYACVYEYQVNV